MSNIKKCLITRYDETITEPPFLTIPIDSVDVIKPTKDNLGEQFYYNLVKACREKGYKLKFYTRSSDEKFDYEIIVK